MYKSPSAASRETKMEPLLSFPYNAFLMLRSEYVQILQDDLQAKLLRIIEAHIETQRLVLYREAVNKGDSNQPIDIPKDIFVPISYKLFMNDLFGLVTSENTIKKNLNILIDYKIIFRKEAPKRKYAPPEYSINTTALQILLDALKNPGYQTLIPSILDTLKDSYPQDLIPSWYQHLIPSILKSSSEEQSRVSNVDTNIRKEEDYDSKNESDPPSLTHTSLQSSSGLSTSLMDKQPSIVDNPSLIANAATESKAIGEVSPMADLPSKSSSQRNTEPLLTAEERRIYEYWGQLGFVADITATNKKHLSTLSKHVHSLDEMQSLLSYTRGQEHLKGKAVYLGNLANPNSLTGWKQAKAPPPSQNQPSATKSISGLQNYTFNPPPKPKEPPPGELVKLPEFKLRRITGK